MKTNNKLHVGASIALLTIVCTANAQIRPSYQFPPDSAGKGSVQMGSTPLYFTPYMGIAAGRDDNLFLTSTNETASSIFLFSPGFAIDARGTNTVFQLKYQGQVGRYGQSENDNYVDHTSRAAFDVAFDRRNFMRVALDAIRSHDPRGSTDRAISGRPEIYRVVAPSATYAFGAPGAAGRVELYAGDNDRRYLNNRQTTARSDRELRDLGGAFYWRVAPKTYLLAEARNTNISYRIPSLADGDERRYYGGVSWEATGAIVGTLKAGRLQRKFDVGDEEKHTSWEGIVTWTPRSYSRFDFFTSRQTNESTGVGRYILSSIGGVSWNHNWTSLFSTGVDARYQRDEYRGFDRRDEVRTFGMRAGYKFRRWLTLGAEYTHSNRDSNTPVLEYDKNLYLLTATAAM